MRVWSLRGALLAMAAITLAAASPVFAQQACLNVQKIDITGVSLFPAKAQRDWVKGFEGKCLGLAAFNKVLERVTLAYVDAGYIAARAYLPEQDLGDGSLQIAVVEGRLAEVRFNGAPNRTWQTMAFPKMVGRPVHLRKIEQGLDNIRAMNNYSAEMALDAGEKVGETILRVEAQTRRPWKAAYSSNNNGVSATGKYASNLDVSYDNAFGLNEQWDFGLSKTMRGPLNLDYQGDGNNSASIGLSVPYGFWSFSADYAYSTYFQQIDGIYTPIPVSGYSDETSFAAKRLLHRDQTSKTWASLGLKLTNSHNFIAGTLIESSSRKLTIADLELSHERAFWQGQLSGSLRLEKGLTAFGAEAFSEQPAGQPNAQFSRIVAGATFQRPIKLGGAGLNYTGAAQLQLSPDRLYGGQQFSVGGPSSVRGVEQPMAFGSSGWFMRHELELPTGAKLGPAFGTLAAYGAFDYGQIFAQDGLAISGFHAAGATVGLRVKGGVIAADVSYSKLLSASLPSLPRQGVVSVALSMSF